jgi:putrescine aminotransferase
MTTVAREAGTERERILKVYRAHIGAGLANLAKVGNMGVEYETSGAVVRDDTGRTLLNCGGYGVFTLGHCHPEIVDAVRTQLGRQPLATKFLLNPRLADATEALLSVSPPALRSVLYTNSGTEAAEVALKLARLHGRRTLISMTGGFHGKTMGALSVTGRDTYRVPFEPMLPDVTFVPYGDATALDAELVRHPAARCAVILEPVQSENGVVIPPAGYLAAVAESCRRHDALLIADEVQTGLGRLGAWWGCERAGVCPDILLAGKALGGGVMPIGAVVTSKEIFAPFSHDPYLHSSTFGGNQLAMAAAHATITVLTRDGVVHTAAELGARLLSRLRSALTGNAFDELVREVRGAGLLIGIEFVSADLAGEFMFELMDRGVISCHSLNASEVVRLTPPAILDPAQEDWLIDAATGAAGSILG